MLKFSSFVVEFELILYLIGDITEAYFGINNPDKETGSTGFFTGELYVPSYRVDDPFFHVGIHHLFK